jgi:hypothetical protein
MAERRLRPGPRKWKLILQKRPGAYAGVEYNIYQSFPRRKVIVGLGRFPSAVFREKLSPLEQQVYYIKSVKRL